jgi:hypothetical protein
VNLEQQKCCAEEEELAIDRPRATGAKLAAHVKSDEQCADDAEHGCQNQHRRGYVLIAHEEVRPIVARRWWNLCRSRRQEVARRESLRGIA